MTHLEVEESATGAPQCAAWKSCFPEINSPRQFTDTGSHTFEILDSEGNSWFVLAIAADSVTAYDNGVPCLWMEEDQDGDGTATALANQPMVVFYDVTETGDNAGAGEIMREPRLLRVGVGTPEGLRHQVGMSWGEMSVKTYGTGPAAKTYLFVGDFLGRLLVFDVSYDQLYREATTPYLMDGTVAGTHRNPILRPEKTLPFPMDPFDGYPNNCFEVKLDPHDDPTLLYCALGRGGIGIVDIEDPLDPLLLEVIDTPGIAFSISFRKDPDDDELWQLLVTDLGGGAHLFGE